jgi:hypothetical protein
MRQKLDVGASTAASRSSFATARCVTMAMAGGRAPEAERPAARRCAGPLPLPLPFTAAAVVARRADQARCRTSSRRSPPGNTKVWGVSLQSLHCRGHLVATSSRVRPSQSPMCTSSKAGSTMGSSPCCAAIAAPVSRALDSGPQYTASSRSLERARAHAAACALPKARRPARETRRRGLEPCQRVESRRPASILSAPSRRSAHTASDIHHDRRIRVP